MILLAGCGLGGEPAALEFVHEDRSVVGVRGSVVWDGVAVDRVATLGDEALTVPAGGSVTLRGVLPVDLFVTLYAESAVRSGTFAATVADQLDSSSPQWVVDLASGRYLMAVSRTWDDDHSVVDYVTLEVE